MLKPLIKRHTFFRGLIFMGAVCAGLFLLAGGGQSAASRSVARTAEPESILQSPLVLDDGAAGDRTGLSVALNGNTALVASPNHRIAATTPPGAVAVFQRTGNVWSSQTELLPNEAAFANATFGTGVALDGDLAVVGAPRYLPGNTGAVYVYKRNGTSWSRQARIINNNSNFGSSVAISGDTIIIGDPGVDSAAGAAYIYRLNGSTWELQTTLVGVDRGPSDRFGNSVAIEGNTAVIGVFGDNTDAGFDTGSVYVYARSGTTWTQQAFLTANDAQPFDFFGTSVAISGNTIAIGAYGCDGPSTFETGAAYVFQRSGTTWSRVAKLVATDGKSDDKLGWSIAINGNNIVAGAYYYDLPNRQNTGAAYLFQRSGSFWVQSSLDFLDNGAPGDLYGNGVAISDNTIISGSPNHDKEDALNYGAAYAYIFHPNLRNTNDFEGDGRTDLSVFRPADNTWYAKESSNSLLFTRQFGTSGDLLAPADYDGDGRTDVAVFRPSSGSWFILQSSNSVIRSRQFGTSGDLPVPGDYDGNGLTDIAVYRPANGTWYITMGISNSVRTEQFGASGDRPVPGDYDGDGRNDLAVVRPAD
ncbi:MAG: VCBS repeat-containing protein, partial [Acidobacteria bacterium]|nr:VCBS repeat-containing protein [Acidobacteriota bacterium]